MSFISRSKGPLDKIMKTNTQLEQENADLRRMNENSKTQLAKALEAVSKTGRGGGVKAYADKLKDPRWQKKRLEVMKRDGFACSCCSDTKSTLAVHHRYYISGRLPWEYPLWSLRTLCEMCHKDNHDGMPIRRQEGMSIPGEDTFETMMGFLGAGDDTSESCIWDLSVAMAMLGELIGLGPAFSRVVHFLSNERAMEEEKLPK